MSLGDQQWYPTSVQVTVLKARNLRIKGKNGTNDAYAIMQVGKEKFSTSVADKCVSPEWKEEATFDLPLFHQGNAERCTLYIIAMHRALVGLDKFLGQAVINLVDLHANRSRKKTDWYKLVDKNGKQEKDRGEVHLDIQFMRNNLSASMFDLSMTDKPRSGISKLKDKIRGKKKDGLSDSASAIVPSSVGTDSEGEGGSDTPKKKSKLKSFFGPKSNLQRNVSQSMSTLGTLPEKNSSLSSSRSSGLNVDSPDVKKRFKILGHKRTDSSDSKASLGPFSLLSRSKQNIPEQNNLCINGNHVYAEEKEPKAAFGSTLSLNSSEKGSVEDVRKHHQRNVSDMSIDSLKGLSIPSYKPEVQDRTPLASQSPLEERSLSQVEAVEKEMGRKPGGRSLQEMLDRQEEKESRKQQELERKQEEERKSRLEEQEKKRKEEEELQKKGSEEETQRAEEQRHQEESRVTERLSSLFGIGRKKEEKREEAMNEPKRLNVPSSINPFEDIPLTPDNPASFPEERSTDPRRGARTTLTPTPPAIAFPSRTAKVSAVKPRLALSVLPETDNSHSQSPSDSVDTQSTIHASPLSPSLSTESFESFGMFSDLHSSLAPPKPQRSFIESSESMENLSAPKSDKKRKAPLPPGNHGGSSKTESHPDNGGQVHTQNAKDRPALPLPDYETLFPKKRHGVMSQTRWDHIIAEVNQRNWDFSEEINVDGPEKPMTKKYVVLKDRTSANLNQHQRNNHVPPPAPARHKEALIPPKAPATAEPSVEPNVQHGHIRDPIYAMVNKPKNSNYMENKSHPAVQSRNIPQQMERKTVNPDAINHQLSQPKEKPTPAARAIQNVNSKTDNVAEEVPSVKPRQQTLVKDPVRQVQPDKQVTAQPMVLKNNNVENPDKGQKENISTDVFVEADHLKTAEIPEELHLGKLTNEGKGMVAFDPFLNDNLISKDPWALPQQTTNEDGLFTRCAKKMGNPEDQASTIDKKENKFANKRTSDLFTNLSENGTAPKFERGKQSPSFTEQARASFHRNFSLRKKHSSRQITGKAENSSLDRSVSQSSQDAEDVELTVTSVAPASRTEPILVTSESPIRGRNTLRAWVSPSEAQPVSSGSAVSISKRPHPVKPMNTTESQSSSVLAVGKDPKTITIKEMAVKSKIGESGPFTQLTQEELITLVVKQQAELSNKDARIVELEEYIDNLLVRVMEEQPAILLSLNSKC
ncbi:uncharacterized protein rab11fip1a [Siphateles boraxobius]|uniref:uncharacterized protein rab11fip1a n=1 Tax=Siphateles boraxobius TaxID=180520 RepID=UPI004064C515